MQISFIDKRLEAIYEKVLNNSRLCKQDGIDIYGTHDLIGLGRIADHVRRARHGKKAFYIYNQHLNYTNVSGPWKRSKRGCLTVLKSP